MSVIQTSEFVVPSDPETLKKIKDLCIEMSASMSRSEGERSFQSEAVKELAKDTEVPAKYLKKITRLYHKSNRDAVETENESTVELYDKIFSVEEQ